VKAHRAFQYRVYPNDAQAKALDWTLDRARELYNACLQERRDAYRMAGASVGFAAQCRQLPGVKEVRPEYRRIDAQLLQGVTRRVDRAFAAFFRRVKEGATGKKGCCRCAIERTSIGGNDAMGNILWSSRSIDISAIGLSALIHAFAELSRHVEELT